MCLKQPAELSTRVVRSGSLKHNMDVSSKSALYAGVEAIDFSAGWMNRESTMLEISRIVTALGTVVASTGLVVYGMGTSYTSPGEFETTAGLWMMILGVVATVVGLVIYRREYLEED